MMRAHLACAALLALSLGLTPAGRGAAQADEGRASARVEYERLPGDLQQKMRQHFWGHLPERQRRTLVETYLRMKSYGLWEHVARVVHEKNAPEAPAKLCSLGFEVDGNSGGIVFEALDGDVLAEALKDTGHFREDGAFMGSMHPGQRSLRERNSKGDSLHVSIGPGNLFDTHVDKCGPHDVAGAWCHGTRELAPEAIRDVTGIPGVVIGGDVVPGSREREPEVRGGVRIEWRGPVEDKTRLPKSEPPAGDPLPAEVLERILERVAGTADADFPVPRGLQPDEVPTRTFVAEELAARLMAAARAGESRVHLDMVQYAGLESLQGVVLGAVRRIGAEVHAQMAAAHAEDPSTMPDVSSVGAVTVTFGVPTQGGTVSLTRD